MGAFRLLLASTVMLAHFAQSYPNHLPYFLHGYASVPAFYIVSGFLITFVLTEKYSGRAALFYSNRALRIFPIYWATLALYLVANLAGAKGYLPQQTEPGFLDYRAISALWWANQPGHELGPLSKLVLAIINLGIFGQDVILHIGRWPGLWPRDGFYHGFMFVPQAWTLALELTFYLIAPFVVTRLRVVIALFVLSLAGRAIAIWLGWTLEIDDYTFFPFELAFFMAGSLAYRVYARVRFSKSRWLMAYTVASITTILALTYYFMALPAPFARWVYLLAVSICLPGIVLAGRSNPLDKLLGEFSYPIYLTHMLLMMAFIPGKTVWAEVAAIGCVFAICAAMLYAVERPIDRLRQWRALRPANVLLPP